MIVVIDCGMGNLQSVVRALQRVGGDTLVSTAIDDVAAAEKIVLPGVGAFARGMETLTDHQLIPVLTQKVLHEHTPVLGICLGCQMLTRGSEEGDAAGLGWLPGQTRRMPGDRLNVKVPHLGWNTLSARRDCPLIRGLPADACFYFAHSYCVSCDDTSVVAATTHYGHEFASVLHLGNIFGTQFHPEKSQAHGLTVLRNFVEYA